uniref:Uncharacterized iron-regulated protein n=1 Tax=Candidatus Kentrum sp. FW TaxID=2126338 RepID=A0A450S6L3_9GAMM|nr:MAG: Uncharacterized iron-regulated protein [Candidatus Kentron sp. FW]VFJ47493.1 MAG: Uncharacterized iron-regulated protein [Candidatus Kentron sp. FW]
MWNYLAGTGLILILLSGCHGIPSTVSQSNDTMLPSAINQGTGYQAPHHNHRNTESSSRAVVSHHTSRPTKVVDLKALSELDEIIPRLAEKQVIFIGENHTRFSDHVNQLAIIRGLSDRGKNLAIGMEFFQQPFQAYLDDFIAGNINETDLLSHTEYYERWRYDYRLYQPILDFAREQDIPLIALNISSEIVKKVSEKGWDALTEDNTLTTEELAQIPQTIDRSNKDYEERLRDVFLQHQNFASRDSSGTGWRWRFPQMGGMKKSHPRKGATDFQRFMEVQLLWDESMAARAAKYVAEHPTRTFIVLAGSGHLTYGDGIPHRLKKRVPVDTAIVLPANGIEPDPGVADFLLVSEEKHLPRQGILGIEMETDAKGIQVVSFLRESAAEAAGIETQDRIRFIDSHPIKTIADIRLVLQHKHPGDRVLVGIHRSNWLTGGKELRFEVELK